MTNFHHRISAFYKGYFKTQMLLMRSTVFHDAQFWSGEKRSEVNYLLGCG